MERRHKFSPDYLMCLYRRAGAQYFVCMGAGGARNPNACRMLVSSGQQAGGQTRPDAPVITGPLPSLPPIKPLFDYLLRDTAASGR